MENWLNQSRSQCSEQRNNWNNWYFQQKQKIYSSEELRFVAVRWNHFVVVEKIHTKIMLVFIRKKCITKIPCNQCGFNVGGQERKSMKGHMKVWWQRVRGSSLSFPGKIMFAILTNNICKVEKYNLQFGEIHFGQMQFSMLATWKFDGRGSDEAFSPSLVWTNKFCNFNKKYLQIGQIQLQFGQINCSILTNTICNLDKYTFDKCNFQC